MWLAPVLLPPPDQGCYTRLTWQVHYTTGSKDLSIGWFWRWRRNYWWSILLSFVTYPYPKLKIISYFVKTNFGYFTTDNSSSLASMSRSWREYDQLSHMKSHLRICQMGYVSIMHPGGLVRHEIMSINVYTEHFLHMHTVTFVNILLWDFCLEFYTFRSACSLSHQSSIMSFPYFMGKACHQGDIFLSIFTS